MHGLTFGDIVAERAVDVALSDAGNQTSERWDPAPQIKTLQRDAIVCPLKSTQKYSPPIPIQQTDRHIYNSLRAKLCKHNLVLHAPVTDGS